MPNMKSEKLLSEIMNKLKEYKANPLPSPVEEKRRQKNLMKMFCIYTSMKKREKARQRLEQNDATIHEENTKSKIQKQEEHVSKFHSENTETHSQRQGQLNAEIQEENKMSRISDLVNSKNTETQIQRHQKNNCTIKIFIDEDENIKTQSQCQELHDAAIQGEENTDSRLSDFDSYNQESNSDRISLHNSSENVNETKSENEMSVICISDESEPEELFSSATHENMKTERVFNETEETFNESIEEHEQSINQFLIQLSERLKKLPYRQRSKLEIEFFRRLIEVEECLEFYSK